MNVTRSGLILGLIVSVAIGSAVGPCVLMPRISALEGKIEELEQQENAQRIDFNEFDQEILYNQINVISPIFQYFRNIASPLGILLEDYLLYICFIFIDILARANGYMR